MPLFFPDNFSCSEVRVVWNYSWSSSFLLITVAWHNFLHPISFNLPESLHLKWVSYRWLINTWKDAQHHSLLEKCKSKPQWGAISRWSEWLPSKSLQTINAGGGVKKREPSYTIGGNANWYSHYGEQCGDSLKTGNRAAIQPSNPIAGHVHWGNQKWKRHMYPSVHCSTVYYS